MIIDFQTEAAKRREMVRRAGASTERPMAPRLFESRPSTGGPMWPTVDCGSGWYHEDAMQPRSAIRSHDD